MEAVGPSAALVCSKQIPHFVRNDKGVDLVLKLQKTAAQPLVKPARTARKRRGVQAGIWRDGRAV